MTTHPAQGTGYARVANKITNYLVGIAGVEVVYYAFQDYKNQHVKDRFIDPRITFYDALELDPESPMGFGDNGIVPTIIKEKPDALFLFNDINVTNSILDLIPVEYMPQKKFVYLDTVYPWEYVSLFDKLKKHRIDYIWVFLDYWKQHLVDDLKFDKDKVGTLPLGVDFCRFIDIPQEDAKIHLGFKSDDYVILNMNRNSYRKGWDTTIKAFLELLKRENMNPRLKLFCGCVKISDDGYNIPEIIHTHCIRNDLDPQEIMNNHIFINTKPMHLTDSVVNIIYNAADVGMNTCVGEGFGLTTLEHCYFNRPQIVSGVHALKETLGENAYIIEPKLWVSVSNHEKHGGELAICDFNDFADALQYYFKNPNNVIKGREYVKTKYSWENVYKIIDSHFNN